MISPKSSAVVGERPGAREAVTGRGTLSAFAWPFDFAQGRQCPTTKDQSRPQNTGEEKRHQIPRQHVRRRPQVVRRIDHRVNDGRTERPCHFNAHGVWSFVIHHDRTELIGDVAAYRRRHRAAGATHASPLHAHGHGRTCVGRQSAPFVDGPITIQNCPPGEPSSVASGSVQIEIVYGPRTASVTIGKGGPECACADSLSGTRAPRTHCHAGPSATRPATPKPRSGVGGSSEEAHRPHLHGLRQDPECARGDQRRRPPATVPTRGQVATADRAARSHAPAPSSPPRRAPRIQAESETRFPAAARPSPRPGRRAALGRMRRSAALCTTGTTVRIPVSRWNP